MSTEYALDPPRLYDDVKASLPPGITCREFKPSDPAGRQPDGTMGRLWVPEIQHSLIRDACGNGVWMRKVREEDGGRHGFERPGDVIFERFGMGGGLVHIGKAFEDAGYTMFDIETTVTWDSKPWKCVQCGAAFEPVDYFVVPRPGHYFYDEDEGEEDDDVGEETAQGGDHE